MKKYCPKCEENVQPYKKFNWLAFVLLMGVFYLPVYWLKRKRCPICSTKQLERQKAQKEM